jgi:hypothetical protein
MKKRRLMLVLGVVLAGSLLATTAALQRPDPVAEPFKGITTDGSVTTGLFPIRSTGVSTAPVVEAARAFLARLTPEQRASTTFPVDDDEWRKWNNVHRYARQGVSFAEMTAAQREQAFGLLRASLSAKGLETARDIMRLNETLAELTRRFDEYGEGLYHLTVMGEPSDTGPWGWQLDGHHLIVNYFVLGDQVVMTPTFMGSEPVRAESGKYAGTVVLQQEQDTGLALARSLTPDQRKLAVLSPEKTRNYARAQAFQDNLVLPYEGIRASDLSPEQRKLLLATVTEYVGHMREGHATVRMQEVERHLDETRFAWIGEISDEAVFYYRIHSPVVLIEFDHQLPVALEGPRVPGRRHIHSVVRTPNGNDYGKDLLRQHYEAHAHDAAHGHAHTPR